ncbi:MAG: hypothetical protein ACK5MN_03325 [Lachnospiraceae bacterium]
MSFSYTGAKETKHRNTIRTSTLHALADKINIGDKLKAQSQDEIPGRGLTHISVTVIEKYTHFASCVDRRGLRRTVTWVDLEIQGGT